MSADVRLDDGAAGWVTVEGPILRLLGSDIMVDSTSRREGAGGSHRRALVHGPGDTLVVNWNNDYTGGVVLNDARFKVIRSEGTPKLPKEGVTGQLVATVATNSIDGQPISEQVTLWLCIGMPPTSVALPGVGVQWVPLLTGDAVRGTD